MASQIVRATGGAAIRQYSSLVSHRCTISPSVNFIKQFTSLSLENRRFSTAPKTAEQDDWGSPPPNLYFDRRVKCAPQFDTIKAVDGDNENGEEERVLQAPRVVIPLPERLHVKIHDATSISEEREDASGEVGTIHLDPAVFGCDPIRTDILHRVVVYQRNKKRGIRYPAKTKTVSEVSGSGAKMRPQKGSGRARAGHKRPAHWRGGAKAHGPKGIVQDYTTKLNKKVRRMGMRMALSQKLLEGNLMLVNEWNLPSHRTKDLATLLQTRFDVGINGASAVIVDDSYNYNDDQEKQLVLNGVNANLMVASANLFKVKVMNQLGANVYDLLKYEKVILSLAALQSLEKRLK